MNEISAIRAEVDVDTIVFPFLGAEIGGSHMSTFPLGQVLMEHFGKRCVVISAKNSPIACEAARLGFEVADSGERPVMRNNPLYDLARLSGRLERLRHYGKNSIVHCNDIGTLQSWGLTAKLLRRPVIYHHRALNRMVLPNRMVLKMADAVICVSNHVRRSIALVSSKHVSTILDPFLVPLALDRASARSALLKRHGYEADALIVGFVGNFWHRKRPFFFLDTCRAILTRIPKARFILFGRSGEIGESQLLEYARTIGLAERTTFAGFQLPAEQNIAALDLLLLPAIAEPFGRTPVEALLLGTPYVATADAGHSEIASRWGGGALVDPTATAEQFAQSALATLAQSESTVLSPNRRKAVADELSAEGHARKVLGVYREVMPRK